jgi:hypothetical protein
MNGCKVSCAAAPHKEVLADLPRREIDPRNMVDVFQRAYGFAAPSIVRYVGTKGLAPCVAIIAYNSEAKLGFLTHVDAAHCVPNAIELVRCTKADSLVLFGGLADSISYKIVGAIYNCLSDGNTYVRKIQEDLFRDIEDTGGKRPTRIALDSLTGEVFEPIRSTEPMFDSAYEMQYYMKRHTAPDKNALYYNGDAVAPAEAFLGLVRQC